MASSPGVNGRSGMGAPTDQYVRVISFEQVVVPASHTL